MKDYFKEWHKRHTHILRFVRFVGISLADVLVPVKKVRGSGGEKIVIDPDAIQVWMIGHATTLINLYGTTILTDPVFSKWLPFPRRKVAAGFRVEDLPDIDIIAVSHAHWDHFNIPSIRKLVHKTRTHVIPQNCSDLLSKIPCNEVVEVGWNERKDIHGVAVYSYKPKHWGTRLPWEKMDRLYHSYVFEKNGVSIFFCGDSGYCDVFFKEVGEKHEFDVALLPIGAYNPPSFKHVHMDPEDAVQAFRDLKAKYMIPIHWGTFRLSREPMREPAERLARIAEVSQLETVCIVPSGERWHMFRD